jgi:hypothetical protein
MGNPYGVLCDEEFKNPGLPGNYKSADVVISEKYGNL